MKAVIDRFEGEYAVVLFGDDEIKIDVLKKHLPSGVREGDWLKVVFEIDHKGTREQEKKVGSLLEKLKNKNI